MTSLPSEPSGEQLDLELATALLCQEIAELLYGLGLRVILGEADAHLDRALADVLRRRCRSGEQPRTKRRDKLIQSHGFLPVAGMRRQILSLLRGGGRRVNYGDEPGISGLGQGTMAAHSGGRDATREREAKMSGKTCAAGILAAALSVGPALAADQLYVPLLTYRTGAFAGSGIPIADGMHDYLAMLNQRDGGIGGVKIAIEECETGYDAQKGVECYESTKAKGCADLQPLLDRHHAPAHPEGRGRQDPDPVDGLRLCRPPRSATPSHGSSTRR